MLCKKCKSEIADNVEICPNCGKSTKKKPFYKKWWVWVIVVIVIGVVASSGNNNSSKQTDVSTQTTANDNVDETKLPEATETVEKTENKEDNVPTEYKSALKKAKNYSDMMHMSKKGIYDQLSSEYGEKFSKEAAQYAVDNLDADYKKNALEKAKLYQQSMNMSPAAIKDQLVSEYGEKFTAEEAAYAIEHLDE